MTQLHRIRAFIRNLLFRRRIDRDLRDELASFAGLVEDEARAKGADPASAREAGKRALGNAAATTEAVRQTRAGSAFDRVRQDVGYAVRILHRSPGFAALTILILTLGIGSVTTMFGVADAALFKPMPYRNPDQLVNVGDVLNPGTAEETTAIGVRWDEFDFWRSRHDVFSDAAAYQPGRPAVIADVPVSGTPYVGRVSPELLQMLDVHPRLGRWFTVADGAAPIVLLADSFWRHAFSSDSGVVGRTLTIDHMPYTVIGVMPPTFSAAVGATGQAVAWTPFDEAVERKVPHSSPATVFRIRDGLDFTQAQRAAQAAARSVPGATSTVQVKLLPIDMRLWFAVTNQVLLKVMLGVVAVVLLIACANIANLLLARSVLRRRELAVRAALGASRARLLRQLITEGFVLAALGGLGGIVLSGVAMATLPDVLPRQLRLFEFNPSQLDLRALAVSAAAVVITTIACSLLPAIRSSRADVLEALEGGTRSVGSASVQRLRYGLQVFEIALTLVLVTGTALLASSFIHLLQVPAGYREDGLANANILLPASRYATPVAQRDFFNQLIADVRHVPGVDAATYGSSPAGGSNSHFTVKGRDATIRVGATVYWVDPDYFDVLGVPLKSGRNFDETDSSTSPPVALIDEDTARRFWPGDTAIGKQFRTSAFNPWMTVIGVVGHIKTTAFASPEARAEVFIPQTQDASQTFRSLVVRATGRNPLAPMVGIRAALQARDPSLDIRAPKAVSELYDDVFIEPRLYVVVMSIFAGLAALTAAVGLFALLNYSVSQRRREIGVRIALGAALGDIRRLVIRDAVVAVGSGIAIGLVTSLLLAKLLQTAVFGISVHDVPSYAAAVIALVVMAVLSTLVPARRASRVDPMQALRAE